MAIFFRDVIALLPLLVLFITALFLLLSILFFRSHRISFFITISGISISFFSLYFVWKIETYKVTDLFYVDGFSMLCMMLVLIASLVSSIMSYMWFSNYYFINNRDEFYLLLLIVTIGGIILVNASHLVTLFFGIELISLPLFGLINYGNISKHSLEATIKYALLSCVSTSFLLFGIALVYLETTHLSFVDISYELVDKKTSLSQSMLLMSGVAMMLVGFGFKLSLVPFHLWTADVYQGGSEISVMCLASINKISIFSIFTRFLFVFSELYDQISLILISMSCLSVLFGNLIAIKETNMKRILAYSSISHIGYLLIAIIGSIRQFSSDRLPISDLLANGLMTVAICLFNYTFATLGAFGVLSLFHCLYDYKVDRKDINQEIIGTLFSYRGLFWKDPILSIAFTIIVFALAGIPLTLGFIGKLYLIILSVKQKLWLCITVIVLGTVIGISYYLRVITVLYLRSELKQDIIINSYHSDKKTTLSTIIGHYNNHSWSVRLSRIIIFILSLFLLVCGFCPQALIFLLSIIQYQF